MMILKIAAAVIIGGVCGYLYQRLVGCASGTCPLTANPTITTIYGAVMGLSYSLMK